MSPTLEAGDWAVATAGNRVRVGVVGKYIELQDAYKSVYESIAHAGIANHCKVNVERIDAENLEKPGGLAQLRGLDGILVPGGFGKRGVEGKITAAVHGGFLSVDKDVVTILAEVAELAGEIDVARAQAALERARNEESEHATEAAHRAEARLRAVAGLHP
mgnify:CR=1 FL=1